MNASIFRRVAEILAAASPRRETVKALSAAGLGAAVVQFSRPDAESKKKKKRRCRRRTQSCGGKKKCCNTSGLVICDLVSEPVECANLTQNVCCGQDGATCNPERNGCDCCGELFCVQYESENLCRSEAT